MIVGAGRSSLPASALNAEPGSTADGWGVQFGSPSWKINNGSYTNLGTAYSYTTNDVLMVAVDVDAGKFWVGKNGTWLVSGDPAAGTNALFTNLTGEIIPMIGVYASGNTGSANFGQRPFAYTAPSGFKALCTQNLATPAIGATSSTLASKNMNVALYTGNGTSSATTQAITGVGFQPDLVWIKNRNTGVNHVLTDAVRGTTAILSSNATDTEAAFDASWRSSYGQLTAFGSDGFTVAAGSVAGGNFNYSGQTYVGWAFKGGNGTVSNTSGTITSTVSANPTAGISVVTYTGTGATATVGHGLGAAVKFIIVKQRGTGGGGDGNWLVGRTAENGWTKRLILNTDTGDEVNSGHWNDTAPTSTVFTLGSAANVNGNTGNYVAYCFAEVAGFSKFGSYVGNGSTDGTFIYTGFRPRYIMIKGTNTNHWSVKDTARSPSNVALANLFPNLSNSETSEYDSKLGLQAEQ
jgi:hypothetical protein